MAPFFIGALISIAAFSGMFPGTAAAETLTSINMKLLVISADGNEPSFAAIRSVLDQINVPYEVLIATQKSLDSVPLSDELGKGHYQGVILATGNLGYQSPSGWQSALTAAQWQKLWTYQSTFKVRQATMYTYPAGLPDNYCLANPVGKNTDTTPVTAMLSAAGKTAFNYLNTANSIAIKNAFTYLATSSPGANKITPLLTTSGGNPIASICAYPDGRQNLAITADSNPELLHTLQLGYGVVNWVSKGFFIGQRQIYMNPQPDDLMIANDMWDVKNLNDRGAEFRISGANFTALVNWQNGLQWRDRKFANIRLEMPFNGVGLSGMYSDFTLNNAIILDEYDFKWLSHTYTHENLDAISYTDAAAELRFNNQVRLDIGFEKYFQDSMVQPDISGLNHSQFLTAAYDFGIRNILCDLSRIGCPRGKPNTGYYIDRAMLPANATSSILVIPRYASNLYYNVSTPAEWESEYNYFYKDPGGLFPTFTTYQKVGDIINTESDMWLRYMLKYSIYSVMFHQPNLRAYDGTRSLLGDLIDATLNKYSALFSLPVKSPSQNAQAAIIRSRMNFNSAGVTGVLKLGALGNTVEITAPKAADVPLTGITAGKFANYGGQVQSTVTMAAGTAITAAAPAW